LKLLLRFWTYHAQTLPDKPLSAHPARTLARTPEMNGVRNRCLRGR
jgi:hypothetical protein